MEKYLYLCINLGSVIIPFIASFDKRLRFDRQWRFLFPAIFLTMLVFIPWDMLKTHLSVWGFNPRYLMGIYIGNLPVEEWMFFISIPYACMFTYHALNYLVKKDLLGRYPCYWFCQPSPFIYFNYIYINRRFPFIPLFPAQG